MKMQVIYSIFIEALLPLSLLGLFSGIILSLAAGIAKPKKDNLCEQLKAALPNLNCCTCGFAGCSAYALALAGGDADLSLCLPGGKKTARAVASILGKEIKRQKEKLIVQVCCKGDNDRARYKYVYRGLEDCNAVYALYGGNKICPFGCLGKGSCIRVCPAGAIASTGQGLVRVDREKCTGCGKCITVCPTHVMQYIPYQADYFVACNSTDKEAVVKKYCEAGCTGCILCVKKSPAGGFKVENFLARIDYKAPGERENAALACPPGCIVPLSRKPQAKTPAAITAGTSLAATEKQGY